MPFLYKSNGKTIEFLDFRQGNNQQWEPIECIHKPKEIVKMRGIDDPFAGLPVLKKGGLRDAQYEAVIELEKSFRSGQKRALIVLATGAGKTYTACLIAYRMLSYTPMRRILFLVDRNNLAKQAESACGTFRLTESRDALNNIFTVNRLKSADIPSDSNVVICTIQRLHSLLNGNQIADNDDDDQDLSTGEVAIPATPKLPHDFFDLIFIDECHRSIYGNWQRILAYFDTARLVGLTATPTDDAMAFFNKNCVVNYTLGQSIVDGVNVGCRIYAIKTRATLNGGVIKTGEKIKEKALYTHKVRTIKTKEDKTYTEKELNRSVINPAQIRLILSTYRDAVYTELFIDPQREPLFEFLPKTLIFALNEEHATNITNIAREVFHDVCPLADMNRYVQKITYMAGDSDELIRQFRNDKDFRIAVTCTLVATGTDIKPLEVVMFMRYVESEVLYVQMKGRGVRTIDDEQLRNVTPNAFSKDFFFLIDAVGVAEHGHTLPPGGGGGGEHEISLRELLERIAHGDLPDKYIIRLANVLSRLHNKADNSQREEFFRLAKDHMNEIAKRINDVCDKDYNRLKGSIPPFNDINAKNLERKALVAAVANHPKAREYILILTAGFVTTLMPGEDSLIHKGFTQEEAKSITEAFEKYCNDRRDDIEALRILYNNEGEPITYQMLKDLENKLKLENNRFSPQILWNSYAIVRENDVRRQTKREETEALTNIIQLVKFAFHKTERLECVLPSARKMFNLWHGRKQMDVSTKQIEILSKVVEYIAANGACDVRELRQNDATYAAQLINAFGKREKADEALLSVYNFVVLRKTA